MKKTSSLHPQKIILLFCAFLVIQTSSIAFSKTEKDIVNKKSTFILDVAYNIYYTDPVDTKTYIIGIYGRDIEAKAIYAKLSQMTKSLKIDKKPVQIELFKNMRSVTPVDVIFVSGAAKIRLGDLHEKLSTRPYSLITENYPYGTSALNIAIDNNNELVYEIQPVALRNNGAEVRKKLLENRQRILSAAQWEARISGKKNLVDRSNSTPQITENKFNNNKEDSAASAVINTHNEQAKNDCDCAEAINSAVSKANNKTKWLAIIALLITGVLGAYIFKLKQS
ncbi:MAG: YfiR family protein [Putridiphycobacter sp.]|nr:YfiR family protein [Putridiphycobacter sp.]